MTTKQDRIQEMIKQITEKLQEQQEQQKRDEQQQEEKALETVMNGLLFKQTLWLQVLSVSEDNINHELDEDLTLAQEQLAEVNQAIKLLIE